MGLEFKMLGELVALRDGERIELGSPRQRALLVRLLIGANEVVSADQLVDELWRGEPPSGAMHTLHVYVSGLRKALVDGARVERRASGYCLHVEPHELDVHRFERLRVEGRAARQHHDPYMARSKLTQALDLWRGPALADFADDAFARDEASRLDHLRIDALEQRMWAELECGYHDEIVEELEQLARRHPLREVFWEQLMVALYRSGRQADALGTYRRARSILIEALGIEPGPALRRTEALILGQDPSLAGPSRPERPELPALPAERTSFVGRDQELARATELLNTARLLTLTGAPGSGKTRLALKLAARNSDRFPHGTHFVPLAPIADHQLMMKTVADALDVRETPGETLIECVSRFLRHRTALLVIDNFEHILPAAPLVGELLDVAPGLRIVVTSRTPLAIAGEQVFPVPPLAVPPPHTDLVEAARYDAISLFAARARAADPDFVLDDGNAAAVAEIVASVEGLPLAIELAAARVRSLSPEQLARRLTRRLSVLTGGPADVEGRHRTMRDAIAWSFELQAPEHRALFRRLGVFRGGFTLEAVEAVAECADTAALDGVEALVSGSLLHRQFDSPGDRLGMLEMVREFALEMLQLAGERERAEARHARYYARLVSDLSPSLTRDPTGEGAQRLESEVDNIRAAIRHALRVPDTDLGLQLGADLWRFWQGSHRMTEGRAWLDELLALPGGSAERRAAGLTALAGLAYWQADYGTAMARYADALETYRVLGDQHGEAHTVFSMSLTASWGDDLDGGSRFADEALAAFDRIGSPDGLARAVLARGFVRLRRGDHSGAYDDYTTALVAARELGDQHLAVTLLPGVAASAFHLGRKHQALDLAIEAADEAAGLHNTNLAVWMLDLIATIVADVEPATAVSLAGAAACLRDAAGGGMQIESLGLRNARDIAAGLLTRDELTDSWSAGHRTTLERAIELAHNLRSRIAPG